MSIIYNRTDFVQFFETENILDAETDTIEYGISYADGSQFSIRIQSNDELATLTLSKQELTNPLFVVSLTKVKRIVCDATSVIVYEDDTELQTEPFFVVTIRPHVSWHY